jgi:hypothetical protein
MDYTMKVSFKEEGTTVTVAAGSVEEALEKAAPAARQQVQVARWQMVSPRSVEVAAVRLWM